MCDEKTGNLLTNVKITFHNSLKKVIKNLYSWGHGLMLSLVKLRMCPHALLKVTPDHALPPDNAWFSID